MNLQQLIATHNQKLIELQNLVRTNRISPQEAQARQLEISQLRQQINYMQQQQQQQSTKSSLNVEKFIGKNLMAIAASLLIFISLVVMCVAIIPFIDDYMKTALMFGVSIVIFALGIGLMYKKKSAWSITLASCGMASIFISGLACNLWLDTIPDMMLYIITIVWALTAVILSKKYSGIFEIISLIGLNISIWLSILEFSFSGSTDYRWMIVSTLVMSILYYTILFVGRTPKNSWLAIPRDIFTIAFTFMALVIVQDTIQYCITEFTHGHTYNFNFTMVCCISTIAYIVITGLMLMYNIIRHIKYKISKYDFIFTILSCIMLVESEIIAYILYYEDYSSSLYASSIYKLNVVTFWHGLMGMVPLLLGMVIPIIFMWLTVKSHDEHNVFDVVKSVITFIPLVFWLCYFYTETPLYKHTGFIVLILGITFLGYYYKNTLLKIVGLIIFGASTLMTGGLGHIFELNEMDEVLQVLLSVATFIILLMLIQYFKNQYSSVFKASTIIVGLVGIVFIQLNSIKYILEPEGLTTVLQYLIIFLIAILMIYTPIGTNPLTSEKDKVLSTSMKVFSEIIVYAATLTLMLMYDSDSDVSGTLICAVLLSLVLIGFALINIKNPLGEQFREYTALYGIFKISIVSWVIVAVLIHLQPAVSAISLIIAVLGIMLGFKFKLKFIRIYGLILSVLSVIKISLVDIQSDSSFETALCLFICGVMCFCISFAYNRLDKIIGGNSNDQINMH